jgi:hypothetical protein
VVKTGRKKTLKKFILKNPNKNSIEKVEFDKCAIDLGHGRTVCDYGMWVASQGKVYLIELKGNRVIHGCRQIFETFEYISENCAEKVENKIVFPVIVCSSNNVPRLNANPWYIKLFRATKKEPLIQTRQAETTC